MILLENIRTCPKWNPNSSIWRTNLGLEFLEWGSKVSIWILRKIVRISENWLFTLKKQNLKQNNCHLSWLASSKGNIKDILTHFCIKITMHSPANTEIGVNIFSKKLGRQMECSGWWEVGFRRFSFDKSNIT